MAKKNFYAVKAGRRTGIFSTWAECREQVDGFAGALFQGFATRDEAEAFLGGELSEALSGGNDLGADNPATDNPDGAAGCADTSGKQREETLAASIVWDAAPDEAVAYVDGSYNVESGAYGCGVVFFYRGEELHISRTGGRPELASMRNVAGEIMGARIAMEEAVSREAKKLTIWHDYQGVASWCLGEWKTNREGTADYKAYYDSLRDRLDIRFQKVQGHSGDAGNDLADLLAKRAVLKA